MILLRLKVRLMHRKHLPVERRRPVRRRRRRRRRRKEVQEECEADEEARGNRPRPLETLNKKQLRNYTKSKSHYIYRLLGIAQNFSRERRKRLDNIFTDNTIKRERERERVEMKRKLHISFPINIHFLIISLSSPNNRTLLFIALYNDLSSFAVTNPLKIFNAVFINTLLPVSSSSSSSWT